METNSHGADDRFRALETKFYVSQDVVQAELARQRAVNRDIYRKLARHKTAHLVLQTVVRKQSDDIQSQKVITKQLQRDNTNLRTEITKHTEHCHLQGADKERHNIPELQKSASYHLKCPNGDLMKNSIKSHIFDYLKTRKLLRIDNLAMAGQIKTGNFTQYVGDQNEESTPVRNSIVDNGDEMPLLSYRSSSNGSNENGRRPEPVHGCDACREIQPLSRAFVALDKRLKHVEISRNMEGINQSYIN
jgi:hypothetical protein